MKYTIAILFCGPFLLVSIAFLSLKCLNLKDELATAQANAAVAVEANKNNMVTIETLLGELDKRDQLIREISDSVATIAKERDDAQNALNNMAAENPEVKPWAATPVPDNIWMLFCENGSCSAN